LLGQRYNIPPDTEHPELDCYAHLIAWHSHLRALLNRPLQGDDFIFPAIASTGLLKFGEPMSRSGIEVLLGQAVDGSGVMAGRNGKFTTHCFRRGGAQHRFMWADRKWSLKAVKWWGGWSSSENVRASLLAFSLTSFTVFFLLCRSGQSCGISSTSSWLTRRDSLTSLCLTGHLQDMRVSWARKKGRLPSHTWTSRCSERSWSSKFRIFWRSHPLYALLTQVSPMAWRELCPS
jgi:hypothetical protein